MKNRGFVLMETIVVIVVISVALLSIFSSYNKILSKVKTENKFDTSEYIYMTNYIKEYLDDNSVIDDIYPCTTVDGNTLCDTLTINPKTISDSTIKNFNVKKIYILKNINNFDKEVNDVKNSQYFDAYMIDYIRKLDVGNNDALLIVEYKREALNIDGTQKTDANGKLLFETYIASLEWEYEVK